MKPVDPQSSKRKVGIMISVISSLGIIGAGLVGLQMLSGYAAPPLEKEQSEIPFLVETIPARFEDVTTSISGFGELKSIRTVPVSAEIAGNVIQVHPNLEVGEIVLRDELLLKIDVQEDEILLASSLDRLKLLQRSQELSAKEFLRLEKLHHDYKTGSLSELEKVEQVLNSVKDDVRQLESAIESSRLKIKKSELMAPFTGRIKQVSVEQGQYITPGTPVVTLVDDSILEIHVPLDSEKARRLIRFAERPTSHKGFWFAPVEPLPSLVTWSQNETEITFPGFLHRVVEFDPKTRTVILAVRLVPLSENQSRSLEFPLVEGMFCTVTIPGKVLRNVVRLPRQAVAYDQSVRVIKNNRLKTVPVSLENLDDQSALITSGLTPGEEVIVTPLVNPMENSLVQTSPKPTTIQHARR